MIACICANVGHEDYQRALAQHQGCPEQTAIATGAGLGCGACRPFLEAVALGDDGLGLKVLERSRSMAS